MYEPWNYSRDHRDHPDRFPHFHFINEEMEAYTDLAFPKQCNY